LGECHQDIEHHPPGRGAGVDFLSHRYERDAVFVKFRLKLGKISETAAQTVDLVDDHDIDQTGPDIRHHPLKCGAVGIAAGPAAVVVRFRQTNPAVGALAGNVVFRRIALGIQRIIVLAKLKEQTLTAPNIFYLDLIGAVELGGENFVGGTLFFDGSMRIRDNQRVDDWDGWQDWRIVDIESRYMEINAYYVDMIRAKMKPGMPTALCTHHVPHVRLNGHEPSHYSFYTGMKDLVHELPFDPLFSNYLICGHTHRRVIGEVVPGFMGVTVGSDYDDLKTFVIEV